MEKLISCGILKGATEEEKDNLYMQKPNLFFNNSMDGKQNSMVKLKAPCFHEKNHKHITKTDVCNVNDVNNNDETTFNFYDDINQFKVDKNNEVKKKNNSDNKFDKKMSKVMKSDCAEVKDHKNHNVINNKDNNIFTSHDVSCWTFFLDEDDDDDDCDEDVLGESYEKNYWFKNAFPCASKKKHGNKNDKNNNKNFMMKNIEENNVVYDSFNIPNEACVFSKADHSKYQPPNQNKTTTNNNCKNNYDEDSDNIDYTVECLTKKKNKKHEKKIKKDNSKIKAEPAEEYTNIGTKTKSAEPERVFSDFYMPEEKICYVENIAQKFNTVRKIGSGTFGNVFLAVRKKDQKKVSLKILVKEKTKIEDFCLEFRYSRMFCKHPFVIGTSLVAYVTDKWYVLVQEYAPLSDLLRAVPPRVGLSETKVKLIVRQMAEAIMFVHSRSIVHRDLKLENFLVFQNDSVSDQSITKVKLSDFGVARRTGTVVCKICEGTTYTPPEICNLPRHSHYSVETSADIWSLGVITFSLLTGSFPWQMANLTSDPLFVNFARWQGKQVDKPPEHWVKFSKTLVKFFHRLLHLEPQKRCNLSSIHRYLDHSWIIRPTTSSNNKGYKYEESLLSLDVSEAHVSLDPASSSQSEMLYNSVRNQHKKCHEDIHNRSPTANKFNTYNPGKKSHMNHYKNSQRSLMTTDNIHANAPFLTSGSLFSPLLNNHQANKSTVMCGSHHENLVKDMNSVSLHRYQHFHQDYCQFKDQSIPNYKKNVNKTKKPVCNKCSMSGCSNNFCSQTYVTISFKPKPLYGQIPQFTNKPLCLQECNIHSKSHAQNNNEVEKNGNNNFNGDNIGIEKGNKFRLDRVNRWLTNHVSFN